MVGESSMVPDKEWIKLNNRSSTEFIAGCDNFLDWAFGSSGRKRVRCPCDRCRNTEFLDRATLRYHIFNSGFYSGYTCWRHHGEMEELSIENDNRNDTHIEAVDDLDDLLHDVLGQSNTELGEQMGGSTDVLAQSPNPEATKFYNLIENAKQKLYPGCDDQLTKLSFIVKQLHLKCINKWSDKSMDSLLKHQKEVLPKGALVPDSYYDAKKIVKQLGLDYVKIAACKNDCILYWKENEHAQICPTCGESRWKSNGVEVDGKNSTNYRRTYVPHKILRYFPITPRLQRLYMSRKTAKEMRWHKEANVHNGLLKHPSDSLAWKTFDNLHSTFASDPRSVRLGLASDGFNPYGNMSSSYSVWPVVLVPYNLPPWLCMKQPYFMMALLIPGRNSPGNDIDVYLQPLVEELKQLWEVGVDTFDAYSRQNFNLRAAVLWTINDFPAYGNLSGWVTKGKLACPCCHRDTLYYSLRSKGGYMGHRRFLPPNHRWRKETTTFDGKREHRRPPKPLSGDEVIEQLQKLEPVVFGKSQKRKRYESNWSKKSIFFELPYWRTLLLRHNLDVMHIEKNVSDNVLGTLMGINGKTKDTLKARCDLIDLGIRGELHPYEERGILKKPNAIYNMSPTEKSRLCEFLRELKVPDGFASNISRCVNSKDRKISGMKCHDHHIFLQRLLPLIAKGLLRKEVCEPIIELSIFFKELCNKVLNPENLDEIEKRLAITLCKLEKIFPPAFFDIMIHLPIHLVSEAKLAGPVQYRWMYPIERYLRTLKSYVRNNAHPEGSIAEGYIVDECITFCSRYINTMETKFNRPPRNDDRTDCGANNLSIFMKVGIPKGGSKPLHLSKMDFNEARMYILQNCDEVLPFIEEHKAELDFESRVNQTAMHKNQFPQWFYDRVSKLYREGLVDKSMLDLAVGPHHLVHRFDTYIVNGYRFHTKAHEHLLKCQNSGVLVKGDDASQPKEYYGVLTDIYKFSYIGNNDVFLFKCHWWDVSRNGVGYKTDKWGFTSVNSTRSLGTNENFVLASQAEQVYYVSDMDSPNSLVVNKNTPRDMYSIPPPTTDDDLIEDPMSDDEEAYQEVNLTISTTVNLDVIDTHVDHVLQRNDFEAECVSGRLQDVLKEKVSVEDNNDDDENIVFSSDDEDSNGGFNEVEEDDY